MGFVTCSTYLTKEEQNLDQKYWANVERRVYSDEHIMCVGMNAFNMSCRLITGISSAADLHAAKQWLKLV